MERCNASAWTASSANARAAKKEPATEATTLSYVSGPFDRWMLHEKLLVHLQPKPRLVQRPDIAVLVDGAGVGDEIVAELVSLGNVGFEVAAIVDRREEVHRGGVIQAGHRAVRMDRQL